MKRGKTIGVRLLADDTEEFEKISEQSGMNQSAKIANIVHDWIRFRRSKIERGDITLAGEILKNIFDSIPEDMLIKIAKKNAKFVIKEMQWQVEGLDFEEVSKRITEWNNENDRQLISRIKNDYVKFKQRHDIGKGWSVHQSEMYAEMFRLIDETIVPDSIKHDKTSFSFEVIRHQNE